MENQSALMIVGFSALALILVGAIGFNGFRRKMAGVIGVGGSYIILLGIMLLVTGIVQLIGGAPSQQELVITLVLAGLAVLYMVYVIVFKCKTVGQRIFLPIVAILIALGFIWRLIAAIVFKTPITKPEPAAAKFPANITDPEGNYYVLRNVSGDYATYDCAKTGSSVQFHTADFEGGVPTGWQ